MFPTPPGPLLIDRPIPVDVVNFPHPATREAKENGQLISLLRARFDLRIVERGERPEVLFYSRFRSGRRLHRPYDCLKVFYSGENDRPRPHQADLSLTFDPSGGTHIRLPIWRLYADALTRLFSPWDPAAELAAKSDFCNFVYSNAAARHRLAFLDRLSAYKPVRCGGKLRNNVGGPVADKLAFLGRHKFTIAFENESHPFYSTEKIVEALAARTVPIYWGDPRAAEDFNPAAFINAHDFETLDELAEYVAEVDRDDALYLRHLSAVCREPVVGGLARIHAMDEELFGAFKKLVEHPPQFRAAMRPMQRLLRGVWKIVG